MIRKFLIICNTCETDPVTWRLLEFSMPLIPHTGCPSDKEPIEDQRTGLNTAVVFWCLILLLEKTLWRGTRLTLILTTLTGYWCLKDDVVEQQTDLKKCIINSTVVFTWVSFHFSILLLTGWEFLLKEWNILRQSSCAKNYVVFERKKEVFLPSLEPESGEPGLWGMEVAGDSS